MRCVVLFLGGVFVGLVALLMVRGHVCVVVSITVKPRDEIVENQSYFIRSRQPGHGAHRTADLFLDSFAETCRSANLGYTCSEQNMTQPLQRLRSIIPVRCLGPRNKCPLLVQRSISTVCGAGSQCRRNVLPLRQGKQFSRGYAREVPSPRTPGISQTEYDLRRTILVNELTEGSVCVLVGASMKYSSDSVLYSPLPSSLD